MTYKIFLCVNVNVDIQCMLSFPVIFDQTQSLSLWMHYSVYFRHLAEELIWRDITKLLLHHQVFDIFMLEDFVQLQNVGSFRAFQYEKFLCYLA